MTYGRLKRVENTDPRMGSAFCYWFLKVRSGPAEWQEEHWLVTDTERARFEHRAGSRAGYWPTVRGKLVASQDPHDAGLGVEFLQVQDRTRDSAAPIFWVVTAAEIERIRQRVERNAEDIERNRESWLADLLD